MSFRAAEEPKGPPQGSGSSVQAPSALLLPVSWGGFSKCGPFGRPGHVAVLGWPLCLSGGGQRPWLDAGRMLRVVSCCRG